MQEEDQMAVNTLTTGATQRPNSLVAAVALIVLGALLNLASLPIQPEDGPPMEVVVPVTLALSAIWLGSAWGIWQGMKWAAVVAFVVTAVNALLAAPGIVFAEELWVNIACAIGVVHAIAVCWLLVAKSTRAALR
jgi:hypothetical protein